MKNKLIPVVNESKRARKPRKLSPPHCPEPSEQQLEAAEQIVAVVAPVAAMAAAGLSTDTPTALKSGSMRAALRVAIEKALVERGQIPDIDRMAAGVLVDGLGAQRPVVLGKNEIHDYPDFATRGAFLDRLLKLSGDLTKANDADAGGTWDSLVLQMRRPGLGA